MIVAEFGSRSRSRSFSSCSTVPWRLTVGSSSPSICFTDEGLRVRLVDRGEDDRMAVLADRDRRCESDGTSRP